MCIYETDTDDNWASLGAVTLQLVDGLRQKQMQDVQACENERRQTPADNESDGYNYAEPQGIILLFMRRSR